MLTSLYSAASGMEAAEALHEVTARNLAYAHQPGYRRSLSVHSSFPDTTAASMTDRAVLSTEPLTNFASGPVRQTGRPLDLALQGDGFFVVEGPNGPLYTRNGEFHLDPAGRIVTVDGLPVAGENGPLTLPPGTSLAALEITATGALRVGGVEVGRLQLASFSDPQQLVRAGASLFRAPENVTPLGATAGVVQGSIEMSNVEPVEELVALISASRHYEAAQRALQTVGEATRQRINLQGGR